MKTQELLESLYRLHVLDDRLHRSRLGLRALDEPTPLERQLQKIETELAKYEAALQKLKLEQKDAELELQSYEAKREEDRKKLYGGKIVATRDLQALEHEIENLAKPIGAAEERVLAAMEKVEPLQQNVTKLQSFRKAAKEKLAVEIEQRKEERRRLEANLARDEPLRGTAVAAVDPKLLDRYEKIRSTVGHPGMSIIAGGACGHCHTSIPSLIMREIREGAVIHQCDNCRRIFHIDTAGGE